MFATIQAWLTKLLCCIELLMEKPNHPNEIKLGITNQKKKYGKWVYVIDK